MDYEPDSLGNRLRKNLNLEGKVNMSKKLLQTPFIFALISLSLFSFSVKAMNKIDPDDAEVDHKNAQIRPQIKKQIDKRKQKFEKEGEPSKRPKATENPQRKIDGYIKVFDITEYEHEKFCKHRIVIVDFEKDNANKYLEHCLKKYLPSSKYSPVETKWDQKAEYVALYVASGPNISNLCISGIKNQDDFNYTKEFFEKINHKLEKYPSLSFYASEHSLEKINNVVELYKNNAEKNIEKRNESYRKKNKSDYEDLENYQRNLEISKEDFGIGDQDFSDDHAFVGNFYDYSEEDYSS